MEELTRWVDSEPTLRRFTIEFDGSANQEWTVKVWSTHLDGTVRDWGVGEGHGRSLTFAAVRAIIDIGDRVAKLKAAEPE